MTKLMLVSCRAGFCKCLNAPRPVSLPAPFSNSFAVRFSSRAVVMTGGCLVTIAFLLSSFSASLTFLYFSYGVLAGKYTDLMTFLQGWLDRYVVLGLFSQVLQGATLLSRLNSTKVLKFFCLSTHLFPQVT